MDKIKAQRILIGSLIGSGVGVAISKAKKIFTPIKEARNATDIFSSNKEAGDIESKKIMESASLQTDDICKDIERLAELKDKNILTEEEFNQKKQLLLDKIQ